MQSRYLSILSFLAMYAPLAATAADLRVGMTRYDGGAAIYGLAQNQQIICDSCPNTQDLVLAPARPSIRFEPLEETQPLHFVMPEEAKTEEGPEVEVKAATSPPRMTVFFGFNKATLSAGEKKRIRGALAAGLDPSAVMGYTCRVGSESYNRNLSASRAQAVAKYLRSIGVKVSSVEGLGKKHNKGAVMPKDRRAEILLRERN